MESGQAWPKKEWGGPRRWVGTDSTVGLLVDWQHKAGQSFGWITPIYGLPSGLEEAQYHGGDVYVHRRDIQDPRPGAIVTFQPYVDKQGLGAATCISRCVLRFLAPSGSEEALHLPAETANPCSTYLSASTFYPEFEERGVTLRRYLWDGPLEVYELWGNPRDILGVADAAGLLALPGIEVLLSQSMARRVAAPGRLREVRPEELPQAPGARRFAALSLAGAGKSDVHQLLLEALSQ